MKNGIKLWLSFALNVIVIMFVMISITGALAFKLFSLNMDRGPAHPRRHIKSGSSPYGLVSFSHQHLQFRTDLPVHYHSHLPPLFPPYPGPGPCFRTGICRKF